MTRSLKLATAGALTALASCTNSALFSNLAPTANFIGPAGQPAQRTILVGFINDTPFRAIFTFGAYVPLDNETLPANFGQLRLEGNTSSAQIAQPCEKAFSVGGAELIRLIEDNRNAPVINNNLNDEEALVDGVSFSSAPLGDPLEGFPTEGRAEGLVRLAGIDFTCERTDIQQVTGTGLLIFTFVQDAMSPGGFRIDYSFIPQF